MSNDSQPTYQIQLKESLIFYEYEGIGDVLGIGIDPNVNIENLPDYIQVSGMIDLTGEYLPYEELNPDGKQMKRQYGRSVQKVTKDQDGICEFLHTFPVDIQLSHDDVQCVDELSVNIEHFDYRIYDPYRFDLEASIHINGLKEADQKQDTYRQEPVNEEKQEVIEDPISDRTDDEEVVEEIEPSSGNERDELKGELSIVDYLFSDDEEDRHPKSKIKVYKVQAEQSLEGIAEKYQVSLSKLQRLNQLETPSIYEGQMIYIPIN
ncbi:stage VI sporulation protein D [Pelagirhabdus alkalitolerans]|uniref:Stage VI sporulation protein D n=1 Tax=Pelagirhabdus alkalitolerans TaxID=1612202 RepID=A0A1G6HN64_9BACI|nr:LysM peptidoglycan-binding domain-containing protein [Pelagirhabdus alkalitolerans]SDB95568.1 stage VI sporulation protein D [Pelagirhabdus alkalitolerans]